MTDEVADPSAVADFWQQALGWSGRDQGPRGEAVISPREGETTYGPPSIVFQPVPEGRSGKNRVHLDFVSDEPDVEIVRALRVVTTRAAPWTAGSQGPRSSSPEGSGGARIGGNGCATRRTREAVPMSETTETICHWEQVQRRWKWEWASYHPHPEVYWTTTGEAGVTELLEDATLAADPPSIALDHAFGSRWEKVSGTGTNVVVASADLPHDQAPDGEGWRVVETADR